MQGYRRDEMKTKILGFLKDINELTKKNMQEVSMPENVFFLNEDNDILCLERNIGESRYPYEMDGLILWAHSTGHINACEGNYTIIRKAELQEEPSVEFWGGLKSGKNWFPVSVTGVSKQLFEPFDVKRYLIYSSRAAYYIAETADIIFALRTSVTSQKQLNFTLSAINKTEKEQEIYLAAYIEPMLDSINSDDFWSHLSRFAKRYQNGSTLLWKGRTDKNFAAISRHLSSTNSPVCEETVAKNIFMGVMGRGIVNAEPLKTGKFQKNVTAVSTTDFHVMGDIIKISINALEEVSVNYLVSLTNDSDLAEKYINTATDIAEIEKDITAQEEQEKSKLSNISVIFDKLDFPSVNNVLFNGFLKTVQKQVDLCALGKNYAGDMLGVRDVFQQMEAALMWNPSAVRTKAIMALNHIFDNGRSPRQFTVSYLEGVIPKFDSREFIDQGLWIISMIYKYLSFTNDYSILDEKCHYYEIVDEKKEIFKKTDYTDTVIEHLVKITDYLIGNIDNRTHCLRILFGDWNDSIDALGESLSGQGYGSGVSVMATLQLYSALWQMSEIFDHIKAYSDKARQYLAKREQIKNGLLEYAIQVNDDKNHIVHGWGDEGSYMVGTMCDSDGKCRYSANANSFWCLSGMVQNNPEIKKDIVWAFDYLDAKYGIRTVAPHFTPDMYGIGRIKTLTPGTYENGGSYVHATTFAIMALFVLGEGKKAWEQIEKIVPVSHNSLSKTPFVMPNSYCFNEEYQIDGESMGDWYTGSGATFMRIIIEYVLGIQAELDGLKIIPSGYVPTDRLDGKLKLKGSLVSYHYKNENSGNRRFIVNGKEAMPQIDDVSGNAFVFLNNADLTENVVIEIFD